MVGGLPKESTEERYWDSIDGDELPREPLSGSPGNPWYISPGGPKENATPAGTGERAMSPAAAGQRHTRRLLKEERYCNERMTDVKLGALNTSQLALALN